MGFEFSGKDKSLSSATRIQTDEKYKRGFSTKKRQGRYTSGKIRIKF
jgi:hypothetical protein